MNEPAIAGIPDPEEVLEHLDWIRSLAERLVRDPGEADDLRQEVWLLSQRVARPVRMPLKGWLGGLLRNVVRERRRASKRRADHEQASALERALNADASPWVREVSMQQVVLQRLVRLKEPYLSTLVACYFEGRSHAEIAEREGVTLHAVRSRVQRGIKELRADLAALQAGGTSALALLAYTMWEPAVYASGAAGAASRAGSAGTPAPKAASAGAGTSAPALLAAAVLVGGGLAAGAWFVQRSADEADAASDTTGVARQDTEIAQTDRSPAPIERSTVSAPEDAQVASTEPVVAERDDTVAESGVPVRVVDLDGAPVAGVEVRYLLPQPDGTSRLGRAVHTGADGTARVPDVQGSGTLYCDAPGLFPVGLPWVGEEAETGVIPTAVVGPLVRARGRVLDPDREPVSGARVRIGKNGPVPGKVGGLIERANIPESTHRTGPDGAFEILLARTGAPIFVTVDRPGFQWFLRHLEWDELSEPLELELSTVTNPRTCYGRVVDPAGDPVAGAFVSDGEFAVRTDENGLFSMGEVPDGAVLWAGAPGFMTGNTPVLDDLRAVEIELSGEPLRIEGRAVYADGTPAAGLAVRIASATGAGRYRFSHAGRMASLPVTLEMFSRPVSGYRPSSVAATTDAEGAFVVEGLRASDYELEIIDRDTVLSVLTTPYPAGARGVLVEVPDRLPALEGTLTSKDGAPLGGVPIVTYFPSGPLRTGPMTRTAADGSFRFDGLAPGALVHARSTLPWVHAPTAVGEERTLALVAEPAARLRVTLAPDAPSRAGLPWPTSVAFFDEGGELVRFVVDDLLSRSVEWMPTPQPSDEPVELRTMLVPIRAQRMVLATSEESILVVPLELEHGAEVSLTE
ncbi:MAG: sigma factor-like helix-turn-helix DNA-binding protein [Planctomycetota bacterium]